MATWQFDFFLIPDTSVTKDSGQLRVTNVELDREQIINLERVDISDSSLSDLTDGLPVLKSWSSKIKIWGDFESDRIDILSKGNHIAEIFIRTDIRKINLIFVTKALKFAQVNKLVSFVSADQIFEPSPKLLMNAIQRSDAFRFVVDPHDFLRKLNN